DRPRSGDRAVGEEHRRRGRVLAEQRSELSYVGRAERGEREAVGGVADGIRGQLDERARAEAIEEGEAAVDEPRHGDRERALLRHAGAVMFATLAHELYLTATRRSRSP